MAVSQARQRGAQRPGCSGSGKGRRQQFSKFFRRLQRLRRCGVFARSKAPGELIAFSSRSGFSRHTPGSPATIRFLQAPIIRLVPHFSLHRISSPLQAIRPLPQ